MPSALPTHDPTAAPTLPDAAKVVGWGLVFWTGVQITAAVFTRNATATLAVQAALAEWGAGRMTIAWSDPLAPIATTRDIQRRAGIGLALGMGAAALAVTAAVLTRGAMVAERTFAPGLLGLGLLVALLTAVRDELLVRGVVLRATRGLLPWWAALAATGACAAAARYGLEGTLGMGLALEGLRGVALGALWMRDRGAWMAVAANAGWTWTLGSIAHGGVLDVRFAGEGDASAATTLVVAAAAVAAALWARPRP